MTAANIIAEQLGGTRRLGMMIGAKDFVGGDKSLQFAVGRGAKDGINKIIVTLGADDTYTVEFGAYSPRKFEYAKKTSFSGVYADNLKSVIESTTGFYLSL